MKNKVLLITALVLSVLLTGCVQKQYVSTKTSLELQSIQTKEFVAPVKAGFGATMSVFQDLGYIIATADSGTGFITAAGPKSQHFVPFVGQVQKYRKATAFVEGINANKTRVRLNFVDEEESSSGYGMKGGSAIPVEDPKLYQEAFEKISKAIFVRTNQ
jgi:hypothetical protein